MGQKGEVFKKMWRIEILHRKPVFTAYPSFQAKSAVNISLRIKKVKRKKISGPVQFTFT